MAIDPYRIALVLPTGNIKESQESISLADLAAALGLGGVTRFTEYRVSLISPTNATLNDGSNFDSTFDVRARGGEPEPATSGIALVPLTGGALSTYRNVDQRRCLSLEPAATTRVCLAMRNFAVQLGDVTDFRPTFGAVTSDASLVPTLMSCSWMAWVRKRNPGDGSDSRVTFGFADNTVVFPSAEVARLGLIGDGLGGYRFGSVNAPDGLAAGNNAPTDIDANAVQPAELLNANLGTKWFHVRIKMVPPTANSPGKWGAYLNGRLAATYTTLTNFVRGSQGVATADFTRIEPSLLNFGDAAIVVPAPVFTDIRMWVEEDLTLA